jgi:hypothetical protein
MNSLLSVHGIVKWLSMIHSFPTEWRRKFLLSEINQNFCDCQIFMLIKWIMMYLLIRESMHTCSIIFPKKKWGETKWKHSLETTVSYECWKMFHYQSHSTRHIVAYFTNENIACEGSNMERLDKSINYNFPFSSLWAVYFHLRL